MSTYKVIYERDDNDTWIADIPSVPGCHTFGRTIREARRMIRDALSLLVDDAWTAEFDEEIVLPEDAENAVRQSQEARQRLTADQAEAVRRNREAAEKLVRELGMPLRDAADLLGLSHQRIQQLLAS